MIYKVILKVVARRLQPFLIKYISIAQAAFVENISILDNVMVVMETIHYIRCKTRGNIGDAKLKIDIMKAYFVEEALGKLMIGFL